VIREGRKEEEWGPKEEDMEPTYEEIAEEKAALTIYDISLTIDKIKAIRRNTEKLVKKGTKHLQTKIQLFIDPCLIAMKIAVQLLKTDPNLEEWASNVLIEVFNLIGLKESTELRQSCGLDGCTCHLRILSSLIAEKKEDPDLVFLDKKLI
jgi:hypothetical protein